jgi:hypothetical protein
VSATGDVVYFSFEQWQLATPSHGCGSSEQPHQAAQIVHLALFYERNNLLLNPTTGSFPATSSPPSSRGWTNLPRRRRNLWKRGVEGETLTFRRLDE